MQYLTWAIEEIEKTGHQKAAHHVRIALAELRGVLPDKTDEHAT